MSLVLNIRIFLSMASLVTWSFAFLWSFRLYLAEIFQEKTSSTQPLIWNINAMLYIFAVIILGCFLKKTERYSKTKICEKSFGNSRNIRKINMKSCNLKIALLFVSTDILFRNIVKVWPPTGSSSHPCPAFDREIGCASFDWNKELQCGVWRSRRGSSSWRPEDESTSSHVSWPSRWRPPVDRRWYRSRELSVPSRVNCIISSHTDIPREYCQCHLIN